MTKVLYKNPTIRKRLYAGSTFFGNNSEPISENKSGRERTSCCVVHRARRYLTLGRYCGPDR